MRQFIRSFCYTVFGMFIFFCCSAYSLAGDVSLEWNPSAIEGVAGYNVYVGLSSGNYGEPITIGNQTDYTVTGLSEGTAYYFAVTAYDVSGNESGYSNEVSTVVGQSQSTCDINDDSAVNVVDMQAMVNIILGINPTSSTYDQNQDGRVDVLDLQILNNVVLGLRSCP